MKKALLLVMAVIMAISLAACGDKPELGESGTESKEVKVETYDTGIISISVSEGWTAFSVKDIWNKYEDGRDPYAIQLAKGAKTNFDLFSTANMTVRYYDDSTTMCPPGMEIYDDGKELEPFTVGDYTWHGFTAKSSDMPLILLYTKEGAQLQIDLWPNGTNSSFALEDADVQAILSSISIASPKQGE